MTMITNTQTVPFGAETIYRLVARFEDLRTAFAQWRAVQKTRNELYSLSDNVLRDIGINRWDIDNSIR